MRYRKIHEDQSHAILAHPDGHEIKIAKSGLSPKMKNMLGSIPMHSYAYGTPDEPIGNTTPGPDGLVYGKDYTTETPQSQIDQMLADKTNQMPQQENGRAPAGMMGDLWNKISSVNPAKEGEYISQVAKEQPQVSPSVVSAPNQTPSQTFSNPPLMSSAPTRAVANQMPDLVSGYNSAFNQGEKGIREEMGAKQDLARQQSDIYGRNAQSEQDQLNNWHKTHNDMMNSISTHVKELEDPKNKVDPNRYFGSMSTSGKIATGIGLLLGGIGAGLTGKNNLASDYIDNQIKNDIEAQKENINNKHTILGAYYKMLGNADDAAKMTHAFMIDKASNELQKAAAINGSPMAKAAADQQSAKWAIDKQNIIGPLSLKTAMLGSTQAQQEMPARIGMLHRAGIIDESTRNKSLEEIGKQQNIDHANETAMGAFDQVGKLQTVSNRAMSPLQSSSQINAIWDPMIDKLTKTNEGRVTPITVDLINNLKPKVSDDQETLKIKRAELWKLVNGERSTPFIDSLKPYGVGIFKQSGLEKKQNSYGSR